MLRYIGWACYGLAAIFIFAAATQEDFLFLVMALSAFVSGAIFQGFAQIIDLLTDIRDGRKVAQIEVSAEPAPYVGPVRSAEQISADLARMQAKQSA